MGRDVMIAKICSVSPAADHGKRRVLPLSLFLNVGTKERVWDRMRQSCGQCAASRSTKTLTSLCKMKRTLVSFHTAAGILSLPQSHRHVDEALSVTDPARIYRTLCIEYTTDIWGLGLLRNTLLIALLQIDYGTRVLTRLPKIDGDDIFGQAGVSSPGIIGFARFKSDRVFRHWETSQPEGFTLCPSHPTSQVFRNSYGVTIAKMCVPSESTPWSTALVIKI